MSEITKFDYEGTSISFEFADGYKMINATEMANGVVEKKASVKKGLSLGLLILVQSHCF